MLHHPISPPGADPAGSGGHLAGLLTELAIGFIHLAPAEVDGALATALGAVGEVVGARRAAIYRIAPDRQHMVVSSEWRRAGVPAMSESGLSIRMDALTWVAGRLRAGEIIDVPDVAELPAEAAAERHIMVADGAGAVILLPLLAGDRLIGVVRVDAPVGGPAWPATTAAALRPFGGICANAIAAKRAIAGLEASELRHRSVLDEITDVVVRMRPDGTLSYVNRAWFELTGNPVADTVGADPLANVHPEDRALALEHMAAAIAGTPGVREARFLTHDGGVRWMEVSGRAIVDADGQLAGFSGLLHDVTERKDAEVRLRAARDEAERARDEAERARDEAERASRAKSEFLSRMSHELRTPLNAILGFAQLLELAGLTGEDADNLGMVTSAGRHLLDLINDALDISRIESGRLSVSLEPVNMAEVVAESLDLIRPSAMARRLSLHTAGCGDARVVADRQRLKQILVNLLSNAVKYNRDGGEVRLGWSPGSPDPVPAGAAPSGWLRIDVADTGLGIPAERLGDAFLPFERIGAERTNIDGTGIGLALARSLAEAMGGQVGAHSTVGTGSTFHVYLPLAQPLDPADATGDDPGRQADAVVTHTVLYIEDNTSNTTLMRRILARRPHVRLTHAAEGPAGLRMAAEQRPDLILLDLHLPGCNGDEVLAAIRAHADPALAATPVVVVTADLSTGTERRLMAAGATAFLSKPVDVSRVLATIDSNLPSRTAGATNAH